MSISLLRELIVEILHDKGEVIVYHASPQLDLKRIMPRYSPKFGKKGIFVTQSLESIWNSWAFWALRKPGDTRGSRSMNTYQSVAVYTIRLPRKLFDAAEKAHSERVKAAMAADPENPNALGAWAWDIETFIPEDLLDEGGLTPTSVKIYGKNELEKIERSLTGWKSAGHKPHRAKSAIPVSSKNSARDVYKRLELERTTSPLKHGGVPYDKATIDKLFAELLALAKKQRLSVHEQERVRELDSSITELLASAVQHPRLPFTNIYDSNPVKRREYMYGDTPARPERAAVRARTNKRNREDGDE